MKTRMSLRNRQGGAVAVLVGFSIVLLVGFLAMVIDLGHLYIAKTGLQNAADAAALSGAKELNGTSAGVTSAGNRAIEAAGKNTFFGDVLGPKIGYQPVILSLDNIRFSDSPYTPDGSWKSYSDAYNAPGGLYFVKVDTGQQNLHTLFAVIWGIFNMSTNGIAVAGRYYTPITPIGICAIDPNKDLTIQGDGETYKAPYGFRRGVSYKFSEVNTVYGGLSAGTELYLHPTATSQATCNPSGGSADYAAPFLCTGQSTISGAEGSHVYANTGLAAGKSIAALNTRFDQYGPPLDSALDYTVCPPDENIKQFTPAVAQYSDSNSGWMTATELPIEQMVISALAGSEMLANPDPPTSVPPAIRNKKESQGGCKDTGAGDCSDNYGVLWSYNTEMKVTPNEPAAWTAWLQKGLYPDGPTATWSRTKPPYGYGIETTKPNNFYQQPSHTPFVPPPGGDPRRLLNVIIIQCPGANPGICGQLTVLGIGRFFMQVQASVSDFIVGEFAGLVPQPLPPSNIRLYR